MMHRSCRTLVLLTVAVIVAASGAVSYAQQPGRFLGRDEVRLYGIGLRVEPAHQTVPRDIATIVSTFLQAPSAPDSLPPFAPDAVVKATLRGPAFATTRELSVRPNTPFEIPPLTVAGIYSLDNIRLESGGDVLLRSTPESVTIEVIDRLLVTQVTARALTAAEIREKGIVFDKANFQAYNFSAAFAIEERRVELNFPVLLPQLQGAQDVINSQATVPAITAPSLPTLQTIIPDTLKLQTQIPNLTVVGFTLRVPNLNGQEFLVPPIPGVIVIPGDIGFLNQFFSVMLMVGNVAPAGSNLVVDNLRAEIVLPPGYDQVVGSTDDPLAMARNAQGETARIQAVVQPGPDGALGTPDDIVSIGPGESGSAEYLVEGRREGSHVVEMEISGTLHGLPIGPVEVRGRAAGAVLVRNPTFTLTFTHPEAVAAGEPYSLDVTVSNTSESPANFVSVSLYPRNVSGATIVGEPSRSIENIPPGDSATVSFDLVSRITGKVTAATLDSNENVAGRFALKTAVGELGVPVSPDSLVLPKEAAALPAGVRQAALGLLGKAWSVATAPAAALPPSVQRFSKKIVIDRAVETAAAGFRITLHESAVDSAAQLLMDFDGSQAARLPELNPVPGDLAFAQSNFQGFDSLRRTSIRGDTFAAAVGAMLAPSLQSNGAALFHLALAEKWVYRPRFASLLVSSSGPLPYAVSILDAQGRRVGGTNETGKFIKQIPYADVVPIGDQQAGPAAQLFVLTTPDDGAYTIVFDRIASVPNGPVTVSLVRPGADGATRQDVYHLNAGEVPQIASATGDPLQFSVTTTGAAHAADASNAVIDGPPSIIGALQLADADKLQCGPDTPAYPVGRVIAVLFSEEVTAASVQDKLQASLITNYLVGGNKIVGVALQPGGRIAYVALRDPIGVYIPRELQVDNVMDLRGHAMPGGSVPIETVLDHGGVVSGQVLQADGTPVPFADVRLFYLLQCEEPQWVGITAKTADGEGRYNFDFVSADLRDRIVVVNPEDPQDFRSVPFTIARSGQRLNVDIVFLGRGTIAGRTLSESGQPLANTAVRITSLTDQSQFGAITDAQGRFSVSKVPVGNVFIEAVNTTVNAKLNVSDYIPFAGATVTRDLVLLDVVFRETTVQHGNLRGHVLRADGSTPAAAVPVMVFYQHLSQPGVACPGIGVEECAIALTNTGNDGAFSFTDVIAGNLRVYAFDQGALSEGAVRFTLDANGERDIAVLLNGGLATVHGTVLDADGHPVADARVGGGMSLSTTNASGQFTLTDVPIGPRDIIAVSDALGAKGQARIDIVKAGESVNVTIVLGAGGSISGVVYQADGLTPIANQAVYAFKKSASAAGEGIQVVGSATTNVNGGYRIDHVPVDPEGYFVSVVNSSLNAGSVVPAKLRFNGQVFRADLRLRGAGTVQGILFDDDGVTPLRGIVGISGEQLVVAGGRVAVEFKHVQYFKVAETDLTTGRFMFPGVFVGGFTLTAAGQFSPDPISFDGVMPNAGAVVDVNLRLQSTSQIAGVVYRPDGVTPVTAGTIVRYKSDSFRTICRENAAGEESCESIPQGIQDETVITGDDGRFWLPIVNAGQFTITVEDVATGRIGQAKGSVRSGERAEMSIRLTGLGDLTVRVVASDGVTVIPGARVLAEQVEYPQTTRTFTADVNGSVQFAGGDAFSEGTVIVTATDQRNGFSGRASARIEHDGQQVTLVVHLFDATGSVTGTLYRSDGLTPVPHAEIVIARQGEPIALLITDTGGHFTSPGIPLGAFTVEAFEAATARRAAGSGSVDTANQDVPINLTQLAIGMAKGTLLLGGPLTPLKGWTIYLNQPSLGGIVRPSLQTTTGLDGTYQFPGTTQGSFVLSANKSDVSGGASGTGAINHEGQIVDVPLIATVTRQLFGRVQGLVLGATGQPAAFTNLQLCHDDNCRSGVADADGAFGFDEVPLGRWNVLARSQTTASAGSVSADLLVDNDVADVRLVLSGLSTVTGVVELNNGSPAAFAQLTLEGPKATCGNSTTCTRFADASGAFTYNELAAQQFSITAVDPITGLRGAVGGTLLAGESRAVRIVLQPTAQVTGRVFKANGSPADGVTVELHWTLPEVRSLFVATRADGRFTIAAAPMVAYEMTIEDPLGPGIARRTGQLIGDVDLGDMILDEAPPQVDTLVPAPSSTGVPRSQVIRITFTEPIRPGTATPASISLEGPDGIVTTILEVSDGDRVVTLRPLSPLRDETQYTVRILPEILDRLGKTMVNEYVASFRTEDITAPRWLEISPAPNTGGVTVYSPIRIPFSEPIAPASFSTPFELRDAANALVPGRLDTILGNTVLVFTPNLPLTEDSSYRIRLGTAVDLAGNRQATGLDYTVTTTDRTPPQIGGLSGPAAVIENDLAHVTANVGATHDVGVVDFYINGVMAFADRSAPFELVFQAVPAYGAPGSNVHISAIATDTSGNRGSAANVDVPVIADQVPVVTIASPANGLQVANGARVTVNVRGTDDLGVTRLAYRAGTGLPQDALSRVISPSCRDCVESFAFNVPAALAPGTTIVIEASAVDSKGQTTSATPISLTVIDSVNPTVMITGATTGARVNPGQSVTAVVTAQDPGAVASIAFTASGAASFTETRTVTPAQNSVVTSFTFTMPANAQPGQTVSLDAVATDRAGNVGTAARVILPVADRNRPTLTLRTSDGSPVAAPGRSITVIATAEDEIAVNRIELNGVNGFAYSDARQVSPPAGSAQLTFTVPVPVSAQPGTTLTLQGRAFDLSGNVSLSATLTLSVTAVSDVTLPASVILAAGETTPITVLLPGAVPGTRVDLASSNTNVATVTPSIVFNAGETSRTIDVTGLSGGTAAISASVLGVERATMTATVRGGIVRGRIVDAFLNPIPGATVTVTGGGSQSIESDTNGDYIVEGVNGPDVEVRVLDPVSQRRGYAAGHMTRPGGSITLNILIVNAGRVSGVVMMPDGVTPAGAGARVDLYDLQNGSSLLTTTFTNDDGEYEFPLVSVGSYRVRASDITGNIGQSSVSIDATGDDRIANVVYLGRGRVSVRVINGSGVAVPNALLQFASSTILGWSNPIELPAGPDGSYTFENVPVGTFSVTGRDPSTTNAGTASGVLTFHGQELAVEITVASYGSVEGTVFRAGGTTPVAGALVTANQLYRATADDQGRFAFPILPLGSVQIVARDESTSSIGVATSVLSTNAQLRTVNVLLAAQGTLVVTVVDAGGAPVSDTRVAVVSGVYPYQQVVNGRTDSQGVAVLSHVQAGNFSANATSGSRSGTTAGTLEPAQILPVTVTLSPTGSIAGVLYGPDGATPASGSVSVIVPGYYTYTVATAQVGNNGVYRFDGLLLNREYTLAANDQAGLARARRGGITLTSNGELFTGDLTFVGLGTVSGRVLNPDSSSAGGIGVTLRSLHPTFGQTRYATTDAAGYWELTNVPVAPFSVRSGDSARGVLGEAFGTLGADGDHAVADILLQSNAIDLPVTRQDANLANFDIQQNGATRNGTNSVFSNLSDGNLSGASVLSLTANGTTTAFAGSPIGTVEDGGREVVTRESGVAGLNVTRKVYVPRDGYFARYLETLANPTDQPVTVDVRVRTTIRPGLLLVCPSYYCYYQPLPTSVVTTSSGDATINVANPITADRWAVIDDASDLDAFVEYNTLPAIALVFDGQAAAKRVAAASFAQGDPSTVQYQWNTVTVPAGGTVSLMHFVAQQNFRLGAMTAASRLGQLSPEAIDGLNPEEIATIVNFNVPADGVGVVEALPSPSGAIAGRVFEGDGVTPVPNASVQFRSNHPLFGRLQYLNAGEDGRFTFATVFDDYYLGTRFVPAYSYTVTARHPQTPVVSGNFTGIFADGALSSERNIVLPTGRVTGYVRRHNGTVVNGSYVSVRFGDNFIGSTNTADDGLFVFNGLGAGGYTFSTTLYNPYGGSSYVTASIFATVVAGQTTDASITFGPTGTAEVTVQNASGQPAVGRYVTISDGTFTRNAYTDSGGVVRFEDLPVGTYQASVVEPNSNVTTIAPVTVVVDQTATVTLALVAVAPVNVTVTRPAGAAVQSSRVTIRYTRNGVERVLQQLTSVTGLTQFVGVPAGPFSLTAEHPVRTALTATASGDVMAEAQAVSVNLVLPAVSVVTGTVRQPAPSNALVPGMTVTLTSANTAIPVLSSVTDAQGVFRFDAVGLGTYALFTQNVSLNLLGTANGSVTADDQTVTTNIVVLNNVVTLPLNLTDANGFLFDIQSTGVLIDGSNDAFNGAMSLRLFQGTSNVAWNASGTGFLEDGGREVALQRLTSQNTFGLQVTRKVYVPSDGYMARYLEVLQNPTASPITVSAQIQTLLGSGSGTLTTATSSGDTTFGIEDYWLVSDDDNGSSPYPSSDPTVAHIVGGPGAATSLLLASRTGGTVTYRWNNVTVPAGGRVTLMHFVVQSFTQAKSTAAAQRLVQLPPEAIAGLSAEEIASIVTFAVPADGSSQLPAIAPPPMGTVNGSVRAHDGTTAVPASVVLENADPIFGRRVSINANTGSFTNAQVRVGDFTARAVSSGITSPVVAGTFAGGATTTTTQIVFSNTGGVTGSVVRHNGLPASGNFARADIDTSSVYLDASGHFTMLMLQPHATTVYAYVPSAGGGNYLRGSAPVTITAGQTSNVVVQIEATGRVQGFVRRPNGTGVADVQVTFSSSVTSKSTTTDATGAYVFEDVQEGAGTIYAQSYNSGATGQATTTVVRDVTQQVNITLSPTGTLTGRVSNPDGSPVANGQLFIYGVVPSQYAYTDADGNYTFTDILIGCCINMTAYSTDGSGVTRQASVQLTSDGQVLVQNFVLPARVTLRVQVFDAAGSPFASANVYLNNGYRGTTDGNGFLTLPGVWQTPYTLQATYYSVGTIGYASGTITDADHGRVIDVRIDSAKSATFSGTLYAADGATRIPGYVYVYDVASGGYASQWAETGAYQLTFSINSAGYRIDSYPAGGGDALTRTGTVTSAGQAVANDFTFPLSVIQGFARYANQNPVEYPSVFIEGLGPDGHTQTFYSQRNGPDGSFIVLGVGVGPFNILAQDNNGLIGAATGQVTVITTPVFADVQMLGVGVVRGRVMDGSEPVQYTSVTLTPSVPLAPSLSTGTNVVGVFAIGDVPATNFTIRACANSRCGTASGTLTPGGDVTVNINLPPPAFLNGVVYGLDGVTPAPGVYVAIQGGNVFYSMYTNASGQFEFNGLPDGNYVVSSTDYPSAAAVPVVLLSGRFTQATLRLGTALTAGPTLSGADGIQYDLDCRGRLMNGGIADDAWAYALAERLRIDGRQFNCESVVTVEDANREAVFGPSPVSDGESEPKWEVTRKVYVPESGRFARFLEIVKNITSATQTLTLRLESGLYSGNALILPVSPSSTGSTYAVTGTADASTTMALGHVFAGAGGQLPSLNFVPGSTSVSDEWEMTVPAGASIAILHFSAQRSPSDIAGATTQAAALAALTDPEALTGLSPVERGLVRNFVVPGGVVPNTGSVTGQVLDVDGTAVGSATVYALDAESGRILAKTVTSPTGAYRIDNVSGPAGVRLLALEPQNEDNGATSLVMFSTPGELLTNVTLRFAQ